MDRSQRIAARVFGFTYLLSLALVMYVFPRFYAPYLVWDNGQETARRFLGQESAVRFYLAGAILHGICMVILPTALYVLLRSASRGVSLSAAFSKIIYAVFWFVSLLLTFAALRTIDGAGSLQAFSPNGLVALAGSQLDSGRDAYYIGLVFNGLGSALFAVAFFQSRFIPRILALWGVLGSLYEGFCGVAYLVQPNFGAVLSPNWYELPPMTFEIILCVWLLVLSFRPIKTTTAKPLVAAAV